MAIYETCIPECSPSLSTKSTILALKAAMRFAWAGPKQLLLSHSAMLLFPVYNSAKSGEVYERGWKERTIFPRQSTLQAGLSMTVWCLGFVVLAAAAATSSSIATQAEGNVGTVALRTYTSLVNKAIVLLRMVKSFWRQCIFRALQKASRKTRASETKDSLERKDGSPKSITHKGTCLCEAVRFRFKAPPTLDLVEGPRRSIGVDSVANQYPSICVPVKKFVLQAGSEQYLKVSRYSRADDALSQAAQTFCTCCGLHIMFAARPDAVELYINALCCKSSFMAPMSKQPENSNTSNVPELGSYFAPHSTGNVAHITQEEDDGFYPQSLLDDEFHLQYHKYGDDDDENHLFTATEASSISESFSSCFADEMTSEFGNSNDRCEEMKETTHRIRKLETKTAAIPWQSDLFPVTFVVGGNADVASLNGASLTCDSSFSPDHRRYNLDLSSPREAATLTTTASTSFSDTASLASIATTAHSVVNDKTHWQLRRFMKKHVESPKSP